jgi:hypothetical protein
MTIPRWTLGALALVVVALPASAQQPAPRRAGQWMGFGIGSGFGRVSCAICEANRHGSVSGYLRGGGTLSRRLLLGLEANGWTRSNDGVDEYLLGLSGAVYWYPNPRRRLYYKAGIGVMRYQIDDGPGRLSSTAFGPSLGAGYDIPLSASVSLTPFASWTIASVGGKIKFNGSTARNDVGLMLIQVGLGLTWH